MKTFDINYTEVDDSIFISIEGELDARTCVKAHYGFQRIDIHKTKAIIIDCRELSYVSSAGIGVLISMYHACLHNGTLLVLHGLQRKVRNVLEILGLEKVMTITDTFSEAVELMREKIPA
ncbi:STAS domain-containing protein [Pontibacter beigongshangensis]|uniref:STAS domain-containing protein n=1 Tax=Pontibacter beigongshangensis TaxID=2574733 RepID=UPI00164F2BAE|nr:STAS domain-containing protein [Pontibacter beigongshangensis]